MLDIIAALVLNLGLWGSAIGAFVSGFGLLGWRYLSISGRVACIIGLGGCGFVHLCFRELARLAI